MTVAQGWPGVDYDRVYELHFTPSGRFVRIETDLYQGFTDHLGGEHKHGWLGPSRGCGAVAPAHFATHI